MILSIKECFIYYLIHTHTPSYLSIRHTVPSLKHMSITRTGAISVLPTTVGWCQDQRLARRKHSIDYALN